MAPQKSTQQAHDKRVQDLLEFGNKTCNLLRERTAIPSSLRTDFDGYVKQLPNFNSAALSAKSREIDALGTDLWNASAGLLVDGVSQPDPRIKPTDVVRLGLLIRVLALALLDTGHTKSNRRSKNADQRARVFKTAVKAARLCLLKNELDYAQKCLETCSKYAIDDEPESLMQLSEDQTDDRQRQAITERKLTVEYFLLRLMHAWKSDRLDLADHFYSKSRLENRIQLSELAEKAADLFYEMGKSLAVGQRNNEAVKWHERGLIIFGRCDPETLSQDAVELRLSTAISLIDELLVQNSSSARQRAGQVIDELEKDPTTSIRVTVPLTKFKILTSERQVDVEQISATLSRLTKLVVLTDDSFKMIMQTIKKTMRSSTRTALTALKTLICSRIVPELRVSQSPDSPVHNWLEKATISYILYSTSGSNDLQGTALEELQELLDHIIADTGARLSTKATHAAQTLLWKPSCNGGTMMAHAWSRLLRHELFDHAGPLNKARIGRKLMRTALDEGNFNLAREAYTCMPVASQNECLTRYLAFKLALRTDDESLALSSLDIAAKSAAKDPTYLYACVLEAQNAQKKRMALTALQAILDERPKGTQLPSLLRCTARLMADEVNANPGEAANLPQEIVKIFELASKSIEDLRQASGAQWRLEVQWWSKNAYNLAIQLSSDLEPEYLVRLLDVCGKFLDCYPQDLGLLQDDRVEQRKLLCTFLSATALIVMGRAGPDGGEYALQCFLHAQDRIKDYNELREKLKGTRTMDQDDLRSFAMLKYELECIMKLEQWDKLGGVLQACLDARPVDRWDTLADLLIIIHGQLDDTVRKSHAEMLTQLLQRIINDTWKKQKDITKVARWLRFTFTMCLDHTQGDFSLKLLGQAASMAEHGQNGKHDPYPDNELQWLATTAFNHAVDLLCDEQSEAAVTWMDGALELARWAADNGSLHAIFTGRKDAAMEQIKA